MTAIRSRLVGFGGYLPEQVLSNEELASRVDTSDEWIRQRTGIAQRHVAAEGEFTSDLAIEASRRALASAGLAGNDIDLIVLATATPDNTFPATAARVQTAIGMTGGAAFDVQAVCAGFIFALTVADNAVRLGQAKRALVIGAETFSRILDWEDRSTCVLFGDGAGAVVLQAERSGGNGTDHGLLATRLHTSGDAYDLLYVDGGPSSTQTVGHLRMEGREIYKHAVSKLVEVIEETMEIAGMTAHDIDWLVPHQANRRIIEGVARRFQMPMEKVVLTIERHANTSAASVPLALAEAIGDGRMKDGDVVVMEAIGGGLSWGAGIARL